MIKIVHNVSTGEISEIELTEAELAKIEQDKQAFAIKQVEAQAKATAKAALLSKLGITADEAALLLA